MINNTEDISLEEVTVFLDDLRDYGSINMIAAAPYIQEEFDCNQRVARSLLREWMKS